MAKYTVSWWLFDRCV